MGLTDWFSGLSPETKTALIMGAFNMGGGLLTGMAQGRSQEAQNQILQQRNQLDYRNQNLDAQSKAAAMMGSSPLQFQKERAAMALKAALLSGQGGQWGVQAPSFLNGLTGNISMPKFGPEALQFLSPQAMASSEAPYWAAAQQLNPNMPPPDLASMGYGSAATGAQNYINQASQIAGAQRAQDDTRYLGSPQSQALQGALAPEGAMATEAQTKQSPAPKGYKWQAAGFDGPTQQKMYRLVKDSGGGFWKTLGKIGLGIGGGIATAMTGGAAAPLLGAAFGAGEGALSGGGWKGALMGAATGGLTGGFGAGGASAPMSFGKAVASTLENPRVLASAVGSGIDGPVGTALQFGSNFLPTSFGGGNYVRNDVNRVASAAEKGSGSALSPLRNAFDGGKVAGLTNDLVGNQTSWKQLIPMVLQQLLGGQQQSMPPYFPAPYNQVNQWRQGGFFGNDRSAWTPPYALSVR